MAALIGADIDTAEKACTDVEAWMQAAAGSLAPVLASTTFAVPSAPVISNTDARPYAGAGGWPERLADHLVSPVRWRSTLETLVEMGSTSFIETGPGHVLAGLAKRTVGAAVTLRGVMVPTDAEDA